MIRKSGTVTTSRAGRELREHGTPLFPAAVYQAAGEDGLPVAWHWHTELEAILAVRGAVIVAVSGEKKIVPEGDGFFINSGLLHSVWPLGGGCMIRSVVFHARLIYGSEDSIFWERYLAPFLGDKAAGACYLPGKEDWGAAALRCVEDAWQAGAKEETGYEFRMRECLSGLILTLFEHTSSAQPKPPDPRLLRDSERVKTMIRYIHENYAEELTTARIAASASISERECLRCFQSVIEISPIQYVKQYRIGLAAEELLATNRKVSEIGADCGFQEMSYFARAFRETYGCPPTEYRKTHHITRRNIT